VNSVPFSRPFLTCQLFTTLWTGVFHKTTNSFDDAFQVFFGNGPADLPVGLSALELLVSLPVMPLFKPFKPYIHLGDCVL